MPRPSAVRRPPTGGLHAEPARPDFRVHQSTISRIERGKLDGMRLPRLAVLIAALGGIEIDLAAERQSKCLYLAKNPTRRR
jgi:hypothetical protein